MHRSHGIRHYVCCAQHPPSWVSRLWVLREMVNPLRRHLETGGKAGTNFEVRRGPLLNAMYVQGPQVNAESQLGSDECQKPELQGF